MKIFSDLHLHSRYSRATSPQMEVVCLSLWGKKKGLNLLATGDCTHPIYLTELKQKLKQDGSGFLHLKDEKEKSPVKFILSGEVSCIYKHHGKTRRQHHLVYFPDFDSVDLFNKKLIDLKCNLRSDGRPIVGLTSKQLLEVVLNVHPQAMLIPAHIWTPWFSLFGSKSGYDSIEECFEDLSKEIFSVETGISTDPAMNWRLSQLDKITLLSNSDSHSLPNIGRNANVFNFDKFEYSELYQTLKNKDRKKFLYTIEFFPQEGRYYYDGHRDCRFSCSPTESKNKYQSICPVCKKSLTLGVAHRIDNLADRPFGNMPKQIIPYKSLVPLMEIISYVLQKGKQSKAVKDIYEKIINKYSEFNILIDLELSELKEITEERIIQAILAVRQGKVEVTPGFDGEYGQVKILL